MTQVQPVVALQPSSRAHNLLRRLVVSLQAQGIGATIAVIRCVYCYLCCVVYRRCGWCGPIGRDVAYCHVTCLHDAILAASERLFTCVLNTPTRAVQRCCVRIMRHLILAIFSPYQLLPLSTNPISSRCCSSRSLGNGFVKPSASMLCVGT